MELKKILVTTDFSDLSRTAFLPAADLARKFGARLYLVHVVESLPPALFTDSEGVQFYSPERDIRLKAQELLARTAADDPSFRGLVVEPQLLENGYAPELLSQFQAENGIGLAVISTQGRTGLGYLLLGSFAEKVIRMAEYPVLTCRPSPETGTEGFQARRILVPHDFSENARSILPLVRLLADAFGSRLLFQYVVEPLPDLPFDAGTEPSPNEASWRTEAPARARAQLLDMVEREFPKRQVEVVVEFGTPFVDIVRRARDFKADLIVMATHGSTGLKHMILGSVTEKVARKAPCSVLTARPTGLLFEHP